MEGGEVNHEIHEVHEKAETLAEIVAEMREIRVREFQDFADRIEAAEKRQEQCYLDQIRDAVNMIGHERFVKEHPSVGDAAALRDAASIERLVRDAIIDYQEMFAHAPNDDAERELVERAERGNAWLVAHGYEPEKTIWDKEESPCL